MPNEKAFQRTQLANKTLKASNEKERRKKILLNTEQTISRSETRVRKLHKKIANCVPETTTASESFNFNCWIYVCAAPDSR